MRFPDKFSDKAEPPRLIHRTLALNFAAQLRLPPDVTPVWLGLVDDGADRWMRDLRPWIGLPTYFFHFKISRTVTNGGRRFVLGGEHLDRLSRVASGRRGQAFYVLPTIGNLDELAALRGDALGSLWLLDVVDLSDGQASDATSGNTVIFLNPPHVAFRRGESATVRPAASLQIDPLLDNALDRRLLESSGLSLGELDRYRHPFFGRAGHWAALVLVPAYS